MMKKIILFVFIIAALKAQTGNDQKIELPDFVITGVQNISFPAKDKLKPELTYTVSDVELQNSSGSLLPSKVEVSAPPEILPDLTRPDIYLNGIFKLGAGIYTLPEGSFQLMANSGNFIIGGKIEGKNITNYVSDAGGNRSGLDFYSEYTLDENGGFLPGLKFRLQGELAREEYNFFASDSAGYKRQKNNGDFEFGISNYLNEAINYELKYRKYLTGINEIDLNENQDDISFKASGGISEFMVKGEALFSGIQYDNDTLNIRKIYNKFYAGLSSDLIPGLTIEGGFNYFKDNSTDRIKLKILAEYYLGRGLSIYGKYDPEAYYSSIRNFVETNRYYSPAMPSPVLINEENSFRASVKYQFATYIEFNAGAGYKDFSALPYFENGKGFFNVKLIDDVSESYLFFNSLFHYGPYGQFYAGVEFKKTAQPDGNYVPYTPVIKMDFSYSYDFSEKITAGADFRYDKYSYADIKNTLSLPAISNAALHMIYHMSGDVDVNARIENLFNRSNYLWGVYQQKPVDIIAGVEYHW